MNLLGLADFLDGLFDGLLMVGLSLVVGSLVWIYTVLRIRHERPPALALHTSLRLLQAGAIGMAVLQALKLVAKVVELASVFGEVPWHAYLTTLQFGAAAVRIGLAVALAVVAARIVSGRSARSTWIALIALALALWVNGAWLAHAVGRFEQRSLLMGLTLLHQSAAAVWVGCVIQLLVLWHRRHRDPALTGFWPIAVSRFSPTGMVSVALLIVTGGLLAWFYVGSWRGLAGTAYGSLLLVKIVMLSMALAFARLNFRAGRSWLRGEQHSGIATRVPFHIEAETFLLIGTLFVAATVSAQPPAIDIPDQTASSHEVLAMFSPKIPRLVTPSHDALLTGESARQVIVDHVPSGAVTEWSDYSHNIAGLFLLAMAVLALLSYRRGLHWMRYWPVGFIALAIFLYLRNSAGTWPLGPIPFWASTFGDAELLQHRVATLLALVLGGLETYARAPHAPARLRYLFPILTAFGGVLLVTHAHSVFEIKTLFLIQSTHVAMGVLAIVMAAGRWLELRLAGVDDVQARIAGLVAMGAMALIGAVLVFYREPLV